MYEIQDEYEEQLDHLDAFRVQFSDLIDDGDDDGDDDDDMEAIHRMRHRRTKSSSDMDVGICTKLSTPTIHTLIDSGPLSKNHYHSLPNSPAATFLAKFGADEKKDCQDVCFEEGKVIGEYEIGTIVGRGTFSECRKGILLGTNKQVALKIIQPMENEQEVMGECLDEVQIWSHLDHPNILPLLNCIFIGNGACMCVTPLCALGNLSDYIKDNGSLDEGLAKTVFNQVVKAVNYLHNLNLAHRDIKLENILLDLGMNAYLCDFGLMQNINDEQQTTSHKGTPAYVPPEVVEQSDHIDLTKSDVWALGIVLYTMISGELPFTEEYVPKLYQNIVNKKMKGLSKQFSSNLHILVDYLLDIDPKRRPTTQLVLQSPWFRS